MNFQELQLSLAAQVSLASVFVCLLPPALWFLCYVFGSVELTDSQEIMARKIYSGCILARPKNNRSDPSGGESED